MRSFAPTIEAYDFEVKPIPPIAILAEPKTLFLIKSLLLVILIIFKNLRLSNIYSIQVSQNN
jgi:hypothetical protein